MRARVQQLTPLERALRLERLGLLGTLSPEDRMLVTRCVEERRYRQGQFLSPLGEPVSSLQVIIEGRVRRRGAAGEDEDLGPGATVGLLAILAGAGEEIELEALEDTLTLELSGEVIEAMLEDSPGLLLSTVRDLGALQLEALRDLPDGAYVTLAAEDGPSTSQGVLGILDKVRWLRRSGLLDDHNVDAFLEMANSFDEARFEPGENLWECGEPSGRVFLLLAGRVPASSPTDRSASVPDSGSVTPRASASNLAGTERSAKRRPSLSASRSALFWRSSRPTSRWPCKLSGWRRPGFWSWAAPTPAICPQIPTKRFAVANLRWYNRRSLMETSIALLRLLIAAEQIGRETKGGPEA